MGQVHLPPEPQRSGPSHLSTCRALHPPPPSSSHRLGVLPDRRLRLHRHSLYGFSLSLPCFQSNLAGSQHDPLQLGSVAHLQHAWSTIIALINRATRSTHWSSQTNTSAPLGLAPCRSLSLMMASNSSPSILAICKSMPSTMASGPRCHDVSRILLRLSVPPNHNLGPSSSHRSYDFQQPFNCAAGRGR